MGFRLLLLSREIQTARILKDASGTIGAELMTFESLELAGRRIRDEKFEVIFVDAAFPGLGRQSFTGMVRKSKFNSQIGRAHV